MCLLLVNLQLLTSFHKAAASSYNKHEYQSPSIKAVQITSFNAYLSLSAIVIYIDLEEMSHN